MAGLLALAVLSAGGWSAHLGLSVREHLEATRSALLRLRAVAGVHDPGLMAGPLADARWHAAEARRLTTGVPWSTVTYLPVLGNAATAVRGLAESAAELTDVLGGLQRAGTMLAAARARFPGDTRHLLVAVRTAEPILNDALGGLAWVSSGLAAIPRDTGVDLLEQSRGTALREVEELRGRVAAAAAAAALLPPMLGGDGPRRYFLAFQTNAEARGTGGLVGAYGILRADRGRMTVERLAANTALATSPVPVVRHGRDFHRRYGPGATRMLSVSNLSPHFPYAAATWAGLWERQGGERLDGAVATDPVGLARLLEVIGPVTLPDGEQVSASNVVDLTEREAYARYLDPAARKRFLIEIAAAVGAALPAALADPVALLPVLGHMVSERRIQIWSRHEAEQRRLSRMPISGVLPTRRGPFAGLVVNNSAGGKLDYYLERSLDYELGPCRGGLRPSTVRIRLTNDVPRGTTLPSYVTGRLDVPRRSHLPGSNLLWVSLYGGSGARMTEARLDGHRTGVIREIERSHPVYSALVEFTPGQSRRLEFDFSEPASAEPPLVPVQPLVRPQRTRVTQDQRGCAP
ncbi:DUF4012 domain-containing protein [Streptosporangium sp. NBC_01810]|uniref:DUF4012 domain-containing protein n=1 Tax=Streptosporangium sp. NBC_01810 TaxID=2975951 RepID=UPI002DDAA397|nr:DUF4012 domain-containing protein [Streptosporangium sp. NBC_01810]WSA27644.1 DUF4012 domain-containing protein [Streptosporangium sp. NBC_01810]